MNDLDLNGFGIVELNRNAIQEIDGGIAPAVVVVGIWVIRAAVSIAAAQQKCY